MKVVNLSRDGDSLKALLDSVADDADYAIVTRPDAADAVVMSLDYFNSWTETIHLLKSPANAAHLRASIAEYRSGQTIERALIDE
ncbi:MAG: type II toxin-antitoxin system prevent-host-death family antitoxin [Leptolyngbya foveolarum]|uniref:Antitoxin n=1 Tax=Leptolyngbya foveolarum TaxID=47253 RepID=A0A2W4TR58_9CYAN|nr:MAG: type II toxin-antitoxin system prevent-host-death family antitoxin [Leptolyngbya foveolarum]